MPPPSEVEDAARELVAACARAEPAAFEDLLRRHGDALTAGCARALRLARGRVGPAALAEAESEVRARLWRDAPRFFGSFRFTCPLEAWLRLMACRTALNWARAESRHRAASLESAQDREAPVPPGGLEAEEDLSALRRGLALLDEGDRRLLEDAYRGGLGYRELARRHGLAPGSVGPMLTRARGKLAGILNRLSGEDPRD